LQCWIPARISAWQGRITLSKIGIQYDSLLSGMCFHLSQHQVTEEEAVKTQSPVLGYNASKKLGEQAAWDFIAGKKPVFDLTVINPDIIIGPMLQPVAGPKQVNETNAFAVYNFFNGKYKNVEDITFPFYHFVRFHAL